MHHLYLARWEWFTDAEGASAWRAPGGGNAAGLDLRSLPQQATAGGTSGLGVFGFTTQRVIADSAYLGENVGAVLSTARRRDANDLLGRTLPLSTTPRSLLWDAFTLHAAPAGLTGCKPLRGRLGGQVRLWLGGELVHTEAFDAAHYDRTRDVFRADYQRHRLRLDALQGAEADAYFRAIRRYTAVLCLRLLGRLDDDAARELLPAQFQDDGWLRPASSVGDTFDRANNTDLNALHTGKTHNGSAATWSWTEVASDSQISSGEWRNVSSGAATDGTRARIEQDLSSDAQYCEGPLEITVDATQFVGPATRFDAGADTCYMGGPQREGGVYDVYALRKFVAGTATTISSTGGYTDAIPGTIRLTSTDADEHTVAYGGAARHGPVSDSSITGNLRVGLHGRAGSGNRIRFASVFAEDLAAGGGGTSKRLIGGNLVGSGILAGRLIA